MPRYLNKTKIEWADYTWNPMTGCTNDCPYCYARANARRFKKSFEPTYHPERLIAPEKVKDPKVIFACSMGDLFCKPIDIVNGVETMTRDILCEINRCEWHDFVMLTKFPERVIPFILPDNLWMGVSIDGSIQSCRRVDQMMKWFPKNKRVLCIEPFLSCDVLIGSSVISPAFGFSWVIIGGMKKPRKVEPPAEWIEPFVRESRAWGIPLFIKDNVGYPEKIQEFPKEMRAKNAT